MYVYYATQHRSRVSYILHMYPVHTCACIHACVLTHICLHTHTCIGKSKTWQQKMVLGILLLHVGGAL